MSYGLPPLASYAGLVLLFVRVVMGTALVYFGYPKIKDLQENGRGFSEAGFRPGIFWGTLIAVVEFVGGISIVLGVATSVWATLAGIHLFASTLWKIFKVKNEFPDYSYDLLMVTQALILLALGPGSYALY